MKRMTPGETVNFLLRPGVVASALGVTRVTVWRWAQPADRGTGGIIPARYHAPLLRLAKERGVNLTADDLVSGRVIEEAAA